MIEQLKTFVTAVDEYKSTVAAGGELPPNSHIVIVEALGRLWKVLSINKEVAPLTSILERIPEIPQDEYQYQLNLLRKTLQNSTGGVFGEKLLSLFGFSHADMFLLRGKSPIGRAIFSTKLKVMPLLKEKKPPKDNLGYVETFEGILAQYADTYNTVVDRQTAIHTIVYDELIASLAQEAPFRQTKRYIDAIDSYILKEGKDEDIAELLAKLKRLDDLIGGGARMKGILTRKQKTEGILVTEQNRRDSLTRKHTALQSPIVLDEIVPDVIRGFGIERAKKNQKSAQQNSPDIVTSGKIRGKLKRAMSMVVHRKFEDLKTVRMHESFLKKMRKRYDKIVKEYAPLLRDEMKGEVVQKLRDELNLWELMVNERLDDCSIKQVRVLRDTIITEITSPTK